MTGDPMGNQIEALALGKDGRSAKPGGRSPGVAPTKRTNNNLVALGTAAVIAVYATGFVHTRAAAAAADAEDTDPTAQLPPAPESAIAVRSTAAPAAQPASGAMTASAALSGRATDSAASAALVSAPPSSTVAVAVPPTVDSVRSAPATTPVAPPVDTQPKLVMPEEHYRDGYYKGYGTSRHGDILVGVRITDGRIVDAYITVCASEYPCDMIEKLTGQVVERQSIRVDRVSGATNSVSAFIRAIAEALTKAQ